MRRENGTIIEYESKNKGKRYRALGTLCGVKKSIGTFDTRDDAEAALKRLAEAREEHTGKASPGSLTLREWSREWLKRRAEDGHHRCVDDSILIYETRIDSHPLAVLPLDRITSKDVRGWVRELGRRRTYKGKRPARQTLLNELGTLRAILKGAVEEELIASNPCAGVTVPKEKRTAEKWTTLSLDELQKILSLPDLEPIVRDAVEFSAHSGVRQGELLGLRWEDVNWDAGRLYVRRSFDGSTKNGEARVIPILPGARAVLKRRWDGRLSSPFVFPTERGRMRTKGFLRHLKDAAKRAGIERNVRWHDLRHSHASYLVSGALGGRPWTLSEIALVLGHKSGVMTTQRYAHLGPDSVFELARRMEERKCIDALPLVTSEAAE